ncbi:MAG: zinc ribbon domain-containing protein [Nitrospiraceae bacterium]|nr:MAG: zinc ribbon domain-containing protein [Nitrospiraceae bacterium]
MPIYEYSCSDCNEIFSLLQSVYPAEQSTACPKCGSSKVKKVMSAFSCSSGSGGSSVPASNFGGGGG